MRVPTPTSASPLRRVFAILALVVGALFLLAACGSDESTDSATDAAATATDDASPSGSGTEGAAGSDDASVTIGDDATPAPLATTAPIELSDGGDGTDGTDGTDGADEQDPGLDADTLGDRGLRLPEEEREARELPSAEPTAAPAPEPTAAPETETVSTAPTPTPEPTPTPPPLNDPIEPQLPTLPEGPVPSDDLVIEGPPTDDGSAIPVFSDAGILACATTEAAIEFLDRGDLTRTGEALQSAAALASTAQEAEISALSSQLGAASDGDAAFEAIVAMLSACAQYGYEV